MNKNVFTAIVVVVFGAIGLFIYQQQIRSQLQIQPTQIMHEQSRKLAEPYNRAAMKKMARNGFDSNSKCTGEVTGNPSGLGKCCASEMPNSMQESVDEATTLSCCGESTCPYCQQSEWTNKASHGQDR